MKINKIAIVAIIASTMVSCGQQLKTKKSLDTQIDSVSYALGVDMVKQIETNFGDDINKDLLIQGFLNASDSTGLLLKKSETRGILMAFFQKRQQEKMKEMQAAQEKKALEEFGEYKKEGEKFLAENKTKKGVNTTESGLQYIVLKEGSGETPKATEKVRVHYHGTLPDGTVFDSSVERGKPSEFFLNQVIKGWTEGLQLMKPGAKYKFYIPQELAYGAQQKGPTIKPFSALVFDVELIEVLNKK